VNECAYCLAAHTDLGKMNGFSEENGRTVPDRVSPWSSGLNLAVCVRLRCRRTQTALRLAFVVDWAPVAGRFSSPTYYFGILSL
jgi:hypothetical protein